MGEKNERGAMPAAGADVHGGPGPGMIWTRYGWRYPLPNYAADYVLPEYGDRARLDARARRARTIAHDCSDCGPLP